MPKTQYSILSHQLRPKSYSVLGPDLYGVSGLTVAVIDDQVTPQASVSSRGLNIAPGLYFSLNDITYFSQFKDSKM